MEGFFLLLENKMTFGSIQICFENLFLLLALFTLRFLFYLFTQIQNIAKIDKRLFSLPQNAVD